MSVLRRKTNGQELPAHKIQKSAFEISEKTQEITYISGYFRPKSASIAFASLSDTAFAEALSLPTAVI